MHKNRIIPQMFDVRPVDETGDLDWKKIQSIGNDMECVGDDPFNEGCGHDDNGSSVNAYILGNPVESSKVPIFHESEFDLGDSCIGDESENVSFKNAKILEEKKQAQRIREEKKLSQIEQQNIFFQQQKNMRRDFEARMSAERQQYELGVKAAREKKDHERAMLLETEKKRLEEQQKELQKIAENNRERQAAYEVAVMNERENREREHAEWLAKEMRDEENAKKLQAAIVKRAEKARKKEALKKRWFGIADDFADFSWRNVFFPPNFSLQFDGNRSLMTFAAMAMIIALSIGGVAYASKGFGLSGRVLGASTDGLTNLNSAINDISHQNFEDSSRKFEKAFENFSDGSAQLESMGGMLLDATRFVPFASKVSSGKNALEAGKHFSAAGKSLNEIAKVASKIKNPIDSSQQSDMSLLDVFQIAQTNITEAKKELDAAQKNIDLISIDDLPKDKQDKFLLIKQNLPDFRSALDLFLNNSHIFTDLLGGNGPRKYLFLFQNNSEMRATGGFIGSYGLMDIANGHVKKFFIDGIFNPDGQLRDKIVPPLPIQKISAAWSMHDSNWFADFPTSAKKAIAFYEKTGGPTADGVITLTPTLMQKLLEITGPIEMPEYDVTLDSKNFIELTQYKVEVDYDKQENKPKKILSDLAPLVLERLVSSKDLVVILKTAQAFFDGLEEKHILLYSENSDLEKIISKQGWSGEILSTPRDYLSVINTNVNGFKTDAVVQENIEHKAEIQDDGSIIDTVTITRKHNGGNSSYEWLNKVNADYMRVYVPKGSRLLDVSGQTREVDKAPLDYDALGFKRDADVQGEEDNITIDPNSGTRVYDESDKTVFANWTYVSPQETMTITYKYLLPFSLFKISIGEKQQADSYSLVAQKQSGSVGSSFVSRIEYPSDYDIKWNFPSDSSNINDELKTLAKLDVDRFFGAVFKKN